MESAPSLWAKRTLPSRTPAKRSPLPPLSPPCRHPQEDYHPPYVRPDQPPAATYIPRPETPARGGRNLKSQAYSPPPSRPPPHRSLAYPRYSYYVGLRRHSLPKEDMPYSTQPFRGPAQHCFYLGDPSRARLETSWGLGQTIHTCRPLVKPNACHRHAHAPTIHYPP
jgi:hypothetical protein